LLLPVVLALLHAHPASAAKIDQEPELAVEQVKQEAVLEVKFARMKRTYGIEDRRTLEVFFELFDLWIMLYRLNKADAALKEVLPACEWRRDDLSIKAVQALAFTRWKQGHYREALSRFHEMEGWMGKNAALCENIGHTYNTIGAYSEAERYFHEALQLTRNGRVGGNSESNEGGILLGLAGVQERRGAYSEALPTSNQAYEFYKARDKQKGWESSLTAKAAMQLSKVHMMLGSFGKAEKYVTEAVRLFKLTAGDDTPLLSGAYERLGEVYLHQGYVDKARSAYHKAYKIEAIKDSFDLVPILEIHNKLVDTYLKSESGLDRTGFQRYFGVAGKVVERVRTQLPQDGNAGAYYKAAGELYVLGNDCARGAPLLNLAVRLFTGETSVDTSQLIKQSQDLVAFCGGTYKVPEEPEAKRAGRKRKAPAEDEL